MSSAAASAARLSVEARRRLGDAPDHPTTSGFRLYSPEEEVVIEAVATFRSDTGRKFPTASDWLYIFKKLGYSRAAEVSQASNEDEFTTASISCDAFGRITRASGPTLAELGLSADKLIGRPLSEFVDDANGSAGTLARMFANSGQGDECFFDMQGSSRCYWQVTYNKTESGLHLWLKSFDDLMDSLSDLGDLLGDLA